MPSRVVIRALRRDEPELLDAIHAGLSRRSRYLRYHTPTPRLTGTMRTAMLDLDDSRYVALVAESRDGSAVGLAQLFRARADPDTAEIAVAVVDAWQRRGIGRQLLGRLVERADAWGVHRVTARVLRQNLAARQLFAEAYPLHLTRRDADVLVLTGGHCYDITMDDILADLVG
jgi:RimJ/RimL family protein N-acetyltransferase